MLAHYGYYFGIGDIHQGLYKAPQSAFRDIITGTNGSQADVNTAFGGAANAFPVSARVGYDSVTGRGAPLWPALVPYLIDTKAPTVKASLVLTHPTSSSSPYRITASWSATDPAPSAGLAGFDVAIFKFGQSAPVWTSSPSSAGSHSFTGKPGANYELVVDALDWLFPMTTINHISPLKRVFLSVPVDDKSFSHSGGWSRSSSSKDFAGSSMHSSTKGATAKHSGIGAVYRVLVRTGPAEGKLGVYLGSTLVKTIDLYSRTTHYRVPMTIFSSNTEASRTFTFKVLGAKRSSSKGTSVVLDGLVPVV